jgi:uncharacterized membrane protein YphA (DoxX/SURF4 family)
VSTTILYLAIVAIWAGFLVPAWIRRPHGAEAEDDFGEFDVDDAEAGVDAEADVDAEARVDAEAVDEDVTSAAVPAEDEWAKAGLDADAVSVPAPPQSRQQMLRARRRVLATLLAVTLGAAACVARGLVPWWTAVPPIVMLVLYVLLLREVAKAEAEAVGRRRGDLAAQAGRAVGQQRRGSAGWAAAGVEQIAEVIDISRRVGDQLYDQYADAAVRAVGD